LPAAVFRRSRRTGHCFSAACCRAKLVEDPELRASFGAAAREQVAARTWTAVGDELIGHYVASFGGSSTVSGTVHSGGIPVVNDMNRPVAL
jgi:hypothetical protein